MRMPASLSARRRGSVGAYVVYGSLYASIAVSGFVGCDFMGGVGCVSHQKGQRV